MHGRVMVFHLIWALQEGSEEGLATGEMAQSIMFSVCKKEDLGLSLNTHVRNSGSCLQYESWGDGDRQIFGSIN